MKRRNRRKSVTVLYSKAIAMFCVLGWAVVFWTGLFGDLFHFEWNFEFIKMGLALNIEADLCTI
jgi:hypothetical protein